MSVLVCDSITKNSNYSIRSFNYNFLDKKIYSIIGKKDSGKHTLLNVITGKEKADTGCVYLDGEPLYNNHKMLERICYLSKRTRFPAIFTINNVFNKMNSLFPKWDNKYAHELIEYFNIKPNSLYSSLSKSMKHLVLGICSLASRANITVYDDPVSDCDVKIRYDFYNFLYTHYQRYPRTIIIVTDYPDEIDYLFDKVLFLDNGSLIDYFTKNELKNNFRYLTGKVEVLKSLLSGIKVIGVEQRGGTLTVCIRKKLNKDEIRKFQKYLIQISEVPIQKIFIYLLNLRTIKKS